MWVNQVILLAFAIKICVSNNIKAFDDTILFNLRWSGGLENLINKDENSLLMVTSENEKYRCYLPTEIKSEKTIHEEYNGPTAIELLKPLFFQVPCSYKLEQYWTYELCHGRHLRQYHEESTFQGIHVQEFLLGRYDLQKIDSKDFVKKGQGKMATIKLGEADLPFVELNMSSGTLCDLSGKQRFTRVLYVCSEDAKQDFYSLKETSTCEYEAVVSTQLLCFHPDYRIQSPPQNDIHCHAIDGAENKPKQLTLLNKDELEYPEENDEISELPNGILSPPPPPPPPMSTVSSHGGGPTPHDPKLVDDFLTGIYCLQGGSGWWKYEFCFGKRVEQFHEEYSKPKQTLLLGVWNEREHLEWLHSNPHRKVKPGTAPKYISHYYGSGSLCDVTQKPRYVEVRLKCKETIEKIDTVSLYLVEPRTCEYVLMVESSFICPLLDTVNENGIFDNKLL